VKIKLYKNTKDFLFGIRLYGSIVFPFIIPYLHTMKKHTLLLSIFTFLLWQVTAHAQIITTVAGSVVNTYTGDGGQATDAGLYNPLGVAVDASGNIYISDTKHHCIRKVDVAGVISTITGNGIAGYSGDNGPAVDAQIDLPSKVAVDASGTIYFVDNANYRLRKISTSGIITTIAGNGTNNNSGDGGLAVDAEINACAGLAIDNVGNIYFGDLGKHTIRKINTAGIITTVVGNGLSGYMGDGGPATAARLNEPFGIDIDNAGNLYIAEYVNNCIRKVSASGIISTLTGFITTGYSGDGGPATNAILNRPVDVIADKYGKLYIADYNNHVIRRIESNGIISTIAGTGVGGFSGDEGVATAAKLRGPGDVALDAHGSLYITDYTNNRIRKISDVVGVGNISRLYFSEIKLYPNPNNGDFTLHITTSVNDDALIVITDMTGRRIKETKARTNSNISFNIDAPSGVYIVTAIIGEINIYKKVNILR
jgi:hypothetical protein